MPTLILWGHALAALAFGGLALAWLRHPQPQVPRIPLAAALIATALWALAVAGIGAGDVVARLAESVRNLAWLALMLTFVRQARTGSMPLYAVYAAAGSITVFATALALFETLPLGGEALAAVVQFRLIARMLAAIVGLMLVHQLAFVGAPRDRGIFQGDARSPSGADGFRGGYSEEAEWKARRRGAAPELARG